MSRPLSRTRKTPGGISGGFPIPRFFALGKFTADFEDDIPRSNVSAKCMGNYCLHTPIGRLFLFTKNLSRLKSFFRVDKSRQIHSRWVTIKLRVSMLQQKNFITIFRGCFTFAKEFLSLSKYCLARNRAFFTHSLLEKILAIRSSLQNVQHNLAQDLMKKSV